MEREPRLSLDADQERVERLLGALGDAERAAAPAGLEERVLSATAAALRDGAASGPASGGAGIERRVIRHGSDRRERVLNALGASQSRRRVAIAAGLGAMVCVAAAWLALRGPSGGPVDRGPGSTGGGERAIAQGPGDGASGGTSGVGGVSASAAIDAEVEAMLMASSLLGGGFDREIAAISVDAATLGLDLADPIGGGWSAETLWSGESL